MTTYERIHKLIKVCFSFNEADNKTFHLLSPRALLCYQKTPQALHEASLMLFPMLHFINRCFQPHKLLKVKDMTVAAKESPQHL